MTAPSAGDRTGRDGERAGDGDRAGDGTCADGADDVTVRMSGPADIALAAAAAALIEAASRTHDVARRDADWLADKIRESHAALALRDGRLVGFGYWSAWEGGRFLSHSGLVVEPEARGRHVGRRLKMALFASSRARYPRAAVMSLTTSPEVRAMNRSLGFVDAPLEQLTSDPAFWEGCRACRNYADVQARGLRCCCEAMILRPDAAPPLDAPPGLPPRRSGGPRPRPAPPREPPS